MDWGFCLIRMKLEHRETMSPIDILVDAKMALVRNAIIMAVNSDIKQAAGCGLSDKDMVDVVVAHTIQNVLYSAELIRQ